MITGDGGAYVCFYFRQNQQLKVDRKRIVRNIKNPVSLACKQPNNKRIATARVNWRWFYVHTDRHRIPHCIPLIRLCSLSHIRYQFRVVL